MNDEMAREITEGGANFMGYCGDCKILGGGILEDQRVNQPLWNLVCGDQLGICGLNLHKKSASMLRMVGG